MRKIIKYSIGLILAIYMSAVTVVADETVNITLDLDVAEIASMTLMTDTGGVYEDTFSASNLSGIIGILQINHNNITGLKLSAQAASTDIVTEASGGTNESNMNFNSVTDTDFEVPYEIRCEGTSNEGNNIYDDYSTDTDFAVEDGEGGDTCLLSSLVEERAQDLEVTTTLAISNALKLMYDSAGYKTETITFTLTDLE